MTQEPRAHFRMQNDKNAERQATEEEKQTEQREYGIKGEQEKGGGGTDQKFQADRSLQVILPSEAENFLELGAGAIALSGCALWCGSLAIVVVHEGFDVSTCM